MQLMDRKCGISGNVRIHYSIGEFNGTEAWLSKACCVVKIGYLRKRFDVSSLFHSFQGLSILESKRINILLWDASCI